MVKKALARFGRIDVLFNHAGIIIVKPFLDFSIQEWDEMMDNNTKIAFLVTRAVLPGMLEQGQGVMVFTSTTGGRAATHLEPVYCASKAAMHQLARAIAVEYRGRGIRANTICPSFVPTRHGEHEIEQLRSYGIFASEHDVNIMQGRICEPEEVASVALFLASDASSFMNGAEVFVDARVTLREALRALEGSRYIKIVRGAHGGAFVEALPVLQQLAVARIARDPGGMMRILEFREANELAATRLAVSRRCVPELKRMRLAVVQMREANGPAELKQAQSIFRLALGDASHNVYIAKSVEDGLAEAFLPYTESDFPALREEAVALHANLFDAISGRHEEDALATVHDIMAHDWNRVWRGRCSLQPCRHHYREDESTEPTSSPSPSSAAPTKPPHGRPISSLNDNCNASAGLGRPEARRVASAKNGFGIAFILLT